MWGSAPTAAAAARAGSSAIKVASSAAAVKRSDKAPRLRRGADGVTVKEGEEQWRGGAISSKGRESSNGRAAPVGANNHSRGACYGKNNIANRRKGEGELMK